MPSQANPKRSKTAQLYRSNGGTVKHTSIYGITYLNIFMTSHFKKKMGRKRDSFSCPKNPRNLLLPKGKGSVQFSSVTQSCPTLCDPMDCSTPSLPVQHQLPEFTQTHVHRVGDATQPYHPLSSPSLPRERVGRNKLGVSG